MRKTCLPILLLFFSGLFLSPSMLTAQEHFSYQEAWEKIDSLSLEGLPRSAFSEVGKIYDRARTDGNSPMMIKAVIHRMLFQAYMEEDSFVKIIEGLREDLNASAFPVRQVLHSLLAETYWNYYEANRFRFFQRSTVADTSVKDFRNWDYGRLLHEVSEHYRLSLEESVRQRSTPVSVLDGALEGDTASRYLRPALYDFLAQRAAAFYLREESNLTPRPEKNYFLDDPALFSDAAAFADMPLPSPDSLSLALNGLQLLQQLTRFHLKDANASSLVAVELQRLEYVHRKSRLPRKDSLYMLALDRLRQAHASSPAYTEIACEQARILAEKEATRLYPQARLYESDSRSVFESVPVDSSRYLKATAICREAISRYPKSPGAENCRALLSRILKKELSLRAETVNYTEEPFRLLISYRNLPEVYLRVVKLWRNEVDSVTFSSRDMRNNGRDRALELLLSKKPVLEYRQPLPGTGDHFEHSAEGKIDALPAGHYAILASETANFRKDSTLLSFTLVQVSALGTFRRERGRLAELYVTDRKTGEPIENARIMIYEQEGRKNGIPIKRLEHTLASDASGRAAVRLRKGERYSTLVVLEKDTLTAMEDSWIWEGRHRRDPQETGRSVFFTDRKVYRPGQTVYFKGFLLLVGRRTRIWTHKRTEVRFRNASGEEIGTSSFTVGEFGTFSGSFIIPENSLPGKMSIMGEYGSAWIEVAEYKRPTFEVRFDPADEIFRLNDSVSINGAAASFSGYPIDGARVTYTVSRRPRFDPLGRYFYPRQAPVHISSGTVQTGRDGRFSIRFPATARDTSFTYSYEVTAHVTDAGGETRSGSIVVHIGSRQLDVSMNIGSRVLTSDALRYEVSARNLNGEAQEADIRLRIYALRAPQRPLRERIWETPDQFLMTKKSFKTVFPYDVYAEEDQYRNWERGKKCLEKNLHTDSTGTLLLNGLRKCESGWYLAEVTAVTPAGEKAKAQYYFNLTGEKPGVPQTTRDFITAIKNSGAPGEFAEFLIGAAEPAFVLYEVHSGEEVTSRQWISTTGRQEKIRVPLPRTATTAGLTVQFTLVKENRIYNHRYPLIVTLPEKKLGIELISFRDKTRPGAKEQWTVRITAPGNEKTAAEMVATLYDASLDQLQKHSWPLYSFSQRYWVYRPDFSWNTGGFVGQSSPAFLRESPVPLPYQFRSYQTLKDYGYSYYGGRNDLYHNYLRLLNWEAAFRMQSEAVKEGTVVSGVVTDEKGDPLPGVSIVIKGTSLGVTTNLKGNYKIKVPPGAILVLNFIGFKTREVTPGSREHLNISLVADETGLDEVVVVGYGGQKRSALTGRIAGVSVQQSTNSIRIRGGSTEQEPVPAPSGEDKAGSGKPGDADGLPVPALQELVPRRNFEETAFFYPHLYTDEEGKISLEFTMPESITRWRMLGFAHTKDLRHGSIEKELVTTREVSVTANAPRFLRAGDRIAFTAKVVNLTSGQLSGKVRLELLNALTLKPVGSLLQDAAVKEFSLEARSSNAVSWDLEIPGDLEAITYRVLASAGAYTDGEEKTLPVLPNKLLVTETFPIQVEAGETGSFSIRNFAGYKQPANLPYRFTLEFTSNPAWYAVQSLPYLMEYPYECAEQLFSRYFANSLSTAIINSSPRIAAIFRQWKADGSEALTSNLEKNQELKSALLEETPWVMEAKNETERRNRLSQLFDLNNMRQHNKTALRKLVRMQLPDGSFPWFSGMEGSRFITQYILAGMGKLRQLNALPEEGLEDREHMLRDALQFVDQVFGHDYEQLMRAEGPGGENAGIEVARRDHLNAYIIHFMYMRSFYPEIKPPAATQKALDFYLEQAAQYWQQHSIYEQSLLAVALHRGGQTGAVQKMIRSLRERAQVSPEKGMYWAENRQGYFWYEAPIETQALLIEAFTEVPEAAGGDNAAAGTNGAGGENAVDVKTAGGGSSASGPEMTGNTEPGSRKEAVEQMKKWLLLNKQTNSWQTTKATVAACYALLLRGSNWLEAAGNAAITLGGKDLAALKPGLKKEAGTGYLKASWGAGEIGPDMEDIRITNPGQVVSWGALYWQYFAKPENVPASGEGLTIRKTLYRETATDAGPVLVPLAETRVLKPGDLLKVRLELSASRDYEFVHLKDLRAASLEPVDILASYRFREGLGYYQAPRDASMNFFIDRLPRGTYVLEYALRVTHRGTFSNGFAQVQCMYAPEFSARSQGQKIDIPAAAE